MSSHDRRNNKTAKQVKAMIFCRQNNVINETTFAIGTSQYSCRRLWNRKAFLVQAAFVKPN